MYDRIYDCWKREKTQPNLQPIDKNFNDELVKYISQLREHVRKSDEKSVNTKLAQTELERAEKLVRELFEMRLQKILKIAELGANPEVINAATGDEKMIIQATLEIQQRYRSMALRILSSNEGTPETEAGPSEQGMLLIRFLMEIPAIVGVDLRPYGPFKPEDVATLPVENAEMLIKGKAAVRIEGR